jgi:Bacterial mobilisation protein (MobC)
MGRPRISEPRSRQLNLRLTVSELETISNRAHAIGMRPVHFGRTLLLGHNDVSQSKTEPANNMSRLIQAQLSRLGNNLNQMVRHLHHTGDPLPADLEPLLNDIRRIIASLSE